MLGSAHASFDMPAGVARAIKHISSVLLFECVLAFKSN